ncbi:MAG: trypsin-like peptidase domain-containing protein [Clostridia bacterium]|nr:trypsin-like peptidase domain-containing protein [Clostridia bacterium]
MYNPYENNNEAINKEQPENQPVENAEKTAETVQQNDGEYHFGGNQLPKQEPVQPQYYTYPQGSYYSQVPEQYNGQNTGQQSSYTWGAQAVPPQPYYTKPVQPKQKKAKDKKRHSTGAVFLAVILSCLISVGSSVGIMSLLLNQGIIKSGDKEAGDSAAYTITKIVDSADEAIDENADGKLSRQQIASKLIPSVVCIQNYQVSTNNFDDYFNSFFGYDFFGYGGYGDSYGSDDSEVSPAGEGSGIIISSDGYIATNAHVVEGATSLKVVTSDGDVYEAELVGSDEVTDLAVIKIDAQDLPAAEFGSADDLSVGDQVIAVGNPGGSEFSSSVTVGYVSALNRQITVENGYTMFCIQTDAAINPGNSGGALVNEYGQVIGINSSKIVSTGYEGLGFAIPSDTAQPIISSLQNYGYVKDRAVLEISGTYLDSMSARFYGLTSGVYVSSVNSQSVAEAGLEKGDVITSIDGVAVTSSTTITAVVSQKKPGDTVELVVDRALSDESGIKITLTLSEYKQ